jgi:hypothetical protein
MSRSTVPEGKPTTRTLAEDDFKDMAMLVSIRILLWQNGTPKQYEDNKRALLNNPEWRNAIARRRNRP